MEKVYVVGSRNSGRSSSDLAVPIDILDQTLLTNTGEIELGRMIQRLAPSFNFSSSSISDGTDALRPATLRGLGPDQTLVLINGKRRHGASLLHINTSVGRGTAGTDLNAIPASAIKRVEILRDGAAAQYGSDALAGVINIVLKDESESKVTAKTGEFSKGDGATTNATIEHTFYLDNGYVFTSLDFRQRDPTNRAGLSGVCQYLQSCEGQGSTLITSDSREINFGRQNFRIGDAESEQVSFVANGLLENFDSEHYGFFTYSSRENHSAGFFRRANESSKNPIMADGEAFYPDGFLPIIKTNLEDMSLNIGYRTGINEDTNLDLSLTSGFNSMEYHVQNSLNASLVARQLQDDANLSRSNIPLSANAGELVLSLTTLNADFSAEYENYALAYGAEIRLDNYEINPGMPYSYLDYDGLSGAVGGIQVFPGFTPENSVDEMRHNISFYVDGEWNLQQALFVTAAARADFFEQFGNTLNGKVSARYDLNNNTGLRASISTGFRAPSMQQLYFNNVSTQFNGVSSSQVGTFRNDSNLAKQIGIPELQEEKSLNLSMGVTYTTDLSKFTVDAYFIEIEDRIVISEQLTSNLNNQDLSQVLQENAVQSAQFFINGADTRTHGLDLVLQQQLVSLSPNLRFTLAANITDTNVTSIFSPPSLSDLLPEQLFAAQAVSIIETWQPNSRILSSFEYRFEKASLAVTFNRFGSYQIVDAGERQSYSAKWLTDVVYNWYINPQLQIAFGANNIFDVTPDENRIGQFRAGTITSSSGDTVVDSEGVFTYSRRAAPFGFNGVFWYLQASYLFGN